MYWYSSSASSLPHGRLSIHTSHRTTFTRLDSSDVSLIIHHHLTKPRIYISEAPEVESKTRACVCVCERERECEWTALLPSCRTRPSPTLFESESVRPTTSSPSSPPAPHPSTSPNRRTSPHRRRALAAAQRSLRKSSQLIDMNVERGTWNVATM